MEFNVLKTGHFSFIDKEKNEKVYMVQCLMTSETDNSEVKSSFINIKVGYSEFLKFSKIPFGEQLKVEANINFSTKSVKYKLLD